MPAVPPSVAEYFSPHVRARGEEYHRDGRVHLFTAEPTLIKATVRGSRPYKVSVTVREDGTVATSCTCPYAAEWDAGCKHVWAAILAAAESGQPLAVPATGAERAGEREMRPSQRDLQREHHRDRHDRDRTPRWRRELEQLRASREARATVSPNGDVGIPAAEPPPATWPADRRIGYLLMSHVPGEPGGRAGDGVIVELMTQRRQSLTAWTAPRRFAYTQAQWLAVPDVDDREIAQMLLGAREVRAWERAEEEQPSPRTGRRFRIRPFAYDTTLRRICETGRAFVRQAAGAGPGDQPPTLRWDDGAPWRVQVLLVPHGEHRVKVDAALVRELPDAPAGAEPDRVALADVVLLADGLAVVADAERPGSCVASRADDAGAAPLLSALADGRLIAAAESEAMALVDEIAALFPRLAPVMLPPTLGVDVVHVPPVPLLSLRALTGNPEAAVMQARLVFAYDDTLVDALSDGGVVSQPDRRRIVARDRVAERRALSRLAQVGAYSERDEREGIVVHRIARASAARAAAELAAEGWRVTIDDRALRQAGDTIATVRSGVDWFDLDAAVDFDGMRVGLPSLLGALRRGERTIALPDGSLGVLPDEWVARWGRLALLGAAREDGVRFANGQAAFLDALLATIPTADVDERFARTREVLRRFEGFRAADAPDGFRGELREYQREGLGWLIALREVGLGGVLADDMGLGKTVQVLALLERLRQEGAGPSLVVVPASIVFNWVQEAARFAPALRVHVHHGAGRRAAVPAMGEVDLVVTTYGTLRRDAAEFRHVEFEYVVLDEAQAIKNAGTATAKAARLLRARHRLAVTGTPIENRLDELWSLFEFLNPGMLGASTAFRRLTTDVAAVASGAVPATEGEGIELVARVVRPYVLRRTKGQVARELPERVEQTVWVDLTADERKAYDELRDHYRASLLGRVEHDGLAKSKIHVLEALLRLRQAAIHPGLIDPSRAGDASGKLDVLLTRLAETTAEGHKSLVFSQFTTMLGIVRERLEAAGVAYEYLDGSTRDRQQRVERFQNDPSVGVFLVSLRAGGVGLNLTAAEYVFLLDPWWNPAVEAQAIDRAHRIGQTRRVIASRLVARDTVEEKVLMLQEGKRALADAIVRADDGMLRTMTREDLEMLLA